MKVEETGNNRKLDGVAPLMTDPPPISFTTLTRDM